MALLAMAPVAALASKKDDSRGRSDRGSSSHSILLKKQDQKQDRYSWVSRIDFGSWLNGKHKGKDKGWAWGKDKDKGYGDGYHPYLPTPRLDQPPSETPIPEPGAALLFATGAGLVTLRLRGSRRRHAS
jgi:hypothetical protein